MEPQSDNFTEVTFPLCKGVSPTNIGSKKKIHTYVFINLFFLGNLIYWHITQHMEVEIRPTLKSYP